MNSIPKAVITGDLIGFTQYDSEEKKIIISTLQEFLDKTSVTNNVQYEIYRGDSIQGIVPVSDALKQVLLIKTLIKSIVIDEDKRMSELDIRLSIGVGTIDYYENKVIKSDGQAFHLSGRSLDSMKRNQTIAITTANDSINQKWEVILSLAEEIINKWTITSSKTVFHLLNNENEKSISQILGISQPSVNSRKKHAGWQAIEKMINLYNSEF